MYLEFILCLHIYCAHSQFCTAFRSSFRKLKYDDTEDMIQRRHTDNFYWFGRFLECALIYYGERVERKQTFYHGLSRKFLFDSFSIGVEIPTSTTRNKMAVQNFAEEKGVILHLSPKYNLRKSKAYYLSVFKANKAITPYPEEKEDLVEFYLFSSLV